MNREMTNKEALEILEKEKAYMLGHGGDYQAQALSMAIKALEQEPCEDAISRKAVIEYIKTSAAELGHDCEKELVLEDILNMPSVRPVACIATVKFSKEDIQELVEEKMKDIVVERKKGKWVKFGQSFVNPNKFLCYSCSECGSGTGRVKTKFCPDCGAEMEVENNG